MAFKSSLVEEAKGCFLLCDRASCKQIVHRFVKVARNYSDCPGYFPAIFVSDRRLCRN